MIPQWRYVHYTDDGCALYECLQCKAQWEGRGGPGYRMFDTGEYVASWHFCPVCGVKWTGSPRTDDNEVGPRRQRIREAWDKRRFGDDRIEWTPPFWWVMEYRAKNRRGGYSDTWHVQTAYDGWLNSAAAIYRELKSQRKIDADDADVFGPCEYRVRITRDRRETMGKMSWRTLK